MKNRERRQRMDMEERKTRNKGRTRSGIVHWSLVILRSSFSVLFLLAFGCGQRAAPLAGGKPVSHWLDALKDPSAEVRQKAVLKLGNAGPIEAAVYPALTEALSDRDASVRREAILALMKFGPDAREAIPLLVDMGQKDEDSQVRAFASRALAKLEAGK